MNTDDDLIMKCRIIEQSERFNCRKESISRCMFTSVVDQQESISSRSLHIENIQKQRLV